MKNKTLSNVNELKALIALVAKLCEKMGLKQINIKNDYVIGALEESALGNRKHNFICTLSELGGKVDLIKDLAAEQATNDGHFIIVSSHRKKISNYFREWLKKSLGTDKIDFWDEAELVALIDKHVPDYWGHNDLFVKTFEDSFLASLGQTAELQQVLKLDKKFEEMLNIFVEPKIYQFKDEENTKRLMRVRFKSEQYLNKKNYFISGDAGTGKTTLLKQIGKIAIENNQKATEKTLPLRLKTSLIADSGYSIKKAISTEVRSLVGETNQSKALNDYRLLLLIDSIDEFEVEKQLECFKELDEMLKGSNINFVLATRNYEKLTKDVSISDHIHTTLSNFDLHQVRQYVTTFFKRDLKKSEDLWSSLLDNKILERIPPTPLTISLVSILYEENGYEIPATITDVYDNFNTFLLGRLNVNSKLDFLKINVKEKILSMYALEIIQSINRIRKKKDEFIQYIIEYFKGQSITIDDNAIPELVKSMTDGTGVLYIDEQGYVTYQHDHFMEYYASREIFNQENRAELEKEVIEKFTEYNWQNTAIFYTGRTKDMKNFLDALVDRVYKYKKLHEHLLAISGLGYVLQSLWMTNSQNRKRAVIAALDLLIKADDAVKQLAEQQLPFLKGIKDTDIAVAHLVWFYMHYNSLTLRDPLALAFDELHEAKKRLGNTIFEKDRTTMLYQLFCIAATLNTGRVKDKTKLLQLFEEDKLLTNPLFVYLFDEAIDVLQYTDEAQLRRDFKLASKRKKYIPTMKFYLENSSEDLRHTMFEKLNPIKNVELFCEGKTDASIISHSYRVLTMGEEPYWSITAVENIHESKAGGAQQLAAFLKRLPEKIETEGDKKKVIIGIFDNDAKGFQEFNGLPTSFQTLNGITKKVKDLNIYALLLPIPEENTYKAYHQEKQVFKFFEIEHYFPANVLQEQKMVKPTAIPGVLEIVGSKSDFNTFILKTEKKDMYLNFAILFHEIDSICKMKTRV